MKRGGGSWKPWYGGGGSSFFQQQKAKPLYALSRNTDGSVNQGQSSSDTGNEVSPETLISYTTDIEPGSYVGWKLYFPEKIFKNSGDLVNKIKTMENHFNAFIHWYNIEEIAQKSVFSLNIQSLEEDKVLCNDWPSFLEELTKKPTETLACIGLAMHNIIVKMKEQKENDEIIQNLKIYCRPIGFAPRTKLREVFQKQGEMVSVTGTVYRVDPLEIAPKIVCFRCSLCSTEVVVKQNPRKKQLIYPSSCHRGCRARSGFIQLLSSPYTIIQPKQMIKIQESVYQQNQPFQNLTVELIQNLVNSVIPGAVVTVTGVVKHLQSNAQKFSKKGEAKILKCYLKSFAVEVVNKFVPTNQEEMEEKDLELIQMMKAEPSPFRLLVHSLCPSIYGREEVKAALVLSLLTGNNILPKRRSQSHILLVGNPGAGKSKLLQTCAELALKGQFVSGPTTTAAGLTASVGTKGSVEAGALILADGGVCCIDELDKMSSHAHVLLESMEQQIISITKCGVRMNASSRVVIIAAANPVGNIYDKSKTLLENLRMPLPLLSRFDLIIPIRNQSTSRDQGFMAHVSRRNTNSAHSSFFSSSSTASTFPIGNTDKITWLHQKDGEEIDTLPSEVLRKYIEYVREHIKPNLDPEAMKELRQFFLELRQLSVGPATQPITMRQFEGLMRLTLARARADMAELATKNHAIDVINLFKFCSVDFFDSDDDPDESAGPSTAKRMKAPSFSSMSKAKQIKAFYEYLKSQVDARDSDVFTQAEMKEMAKEVGICDYYEIITKLNMESLILKTVEGYKIV